MDLVGRQVRGRLLADLMAIPLGAIGQRRPAHRGARGRGVFLLDEIGQAGIRWHDLRRERAAPARRDARTIGRADALRHRADGVPEHRLFRIRIREFAQLRHHLEDDCARLGDAAARAFAHRFDRGIGPDDEIAAAREEAIVVRRIAERLGGRARAEQRECRGETVHLVDRQQMSGKTLFRQHQFAFAQEHVVADAIAATQSGRIDAARALQIAAVQRGVLFAECRTRSVLESIVVAIVAQPCGERRHEPQHVFEVAFVERIELRDDITRRRRGNRNSGVAFRDGSALRHRRLRRAAREAGRRHQHGDSGESTVRRGHGDHGGLLEVSS